MAEDDIFDLFGGPVEGEADGGQKTLAVGQFAGATEQEGTQLESAGLEVVDLASLTEAEVEEVTGGAMSVGLQELRKAAVLGLQAQVENDRKGKKGDEAKRIFPDKLAPQARGVKAKKAAAVDRWCMGP